MIELVDNAKEVRKLDETKFPIKIILNGKEYILRITKSGKLILN
jgi:hemin uptake protein HemP